MAVVAAARDRPRRARSSRSVRQLKVNEIIVAVRQQRGGVLPLRSLLDCRLDGVRVTDLSRFFERVHGQVPIESLKASWLIYGNGYRQNWRRTFMKRVFDILVAAVLLVLTLPIMVLAALLIAVRGRRPGHLPPGARRRARRDVHAVQVPQHGARTPRRTARRAGRRSTMRASRASAGCSAARASTSCRSSSTCCAAR